MGCILESTNEMGEYDVEVRKESFYINSYLLSLYENACDTGGVVEILIKDIPKIRACLDEVERYVESRKP